MSMNDPVELPLTLGKQLAAARDRMKVDQDDLGATLGYSRVTISRWENDKQVPPFTVVAKISRMSGWPLDYFARAETPSDPGPDTPSDQGIPASPCNADTAKVLKFRNAEPTKSARPKAA